MNHKGWTHSTAHRADDRAWGGTRNYLTPLKKYLYYTRIKCLKSQNLELISSLGEKKFVEKNAKCRLAGKGQAFEATQKWEI
jgi:hypothetical protein